MHPKKHIGATALLATLLYTAPQAMAQAVDEATVGNFATAMGAVQNIQRNLSRDLQGAQGEDQAREMQGEAQRDMVSAVRDAGMSVEEYNELANRMNQDPQLRERVLEQMADNQ